MFINVKKSYSYELIEKISLCWIVQYFIRITINSGLYYIIYFRLRQISKQLVQVVSSPKLVAFLQSSSTLYSPPGTVWPLDTKSLNRASSSKMIPGVKNQCTVYMCTYIVNFKCLNKMYGSSLCSVSSTCMYFNAGLMLFN
jgi:hypothetical protein